MRGALDAWRVIWADVSRTLTAAALTGATSDHVPLNTCYVLSASSADQANALSAWLNAPPVRALAAAAAAPASGGYRRHSASVVEQLPLPHGVLESDALRDLALAAADGDEDMESLARIAGGFLGLAQSDRPRLASLE